MAAGSRTQKQDEKWVFAPAIMLSCTLTKLHMQAYIPISEILKKEHCRDKHSFTQEKALYLEVVETEMARAKNLASSNIPNKVQHSTDVLLDCGIPIESGAIVLIKKSPIVQQKRRWLEQKLLAQGHYQVKTVDEFNKLYFCA